MSDFSPFKAFKAIALDLDGTLLNSQHELPPENITALRRAHESGLKVIIASGRMSPTIFPFCEQIGIPVSIVSYNGARLLEKSDGWHPLLSVCLQGDLIKDVIALCIKHFYFLNIYANDELHGFHVKGDYTFSQLYSNQTGAHYTQKIQHSANIPQDNINKLLIITAAQERDAIFDKVEPLYNSRANVFKSQPEYIEFTRQGVSKAHALGLWCDNKGIAPAEILAFGDAENDLEMLNFCGKGIIGTNATQGLKARFPNVSKWSNDQAMVAKELTAAMNW